MCMRLVLVQLLVVISLLGTGRPVTNKCKQWFNGDYNITRDSYDSLLRKEEYLLVSVTSDLDCPTCCGYESSIGDIWMNHFVNPRSPLSQHGIKLARVNIGEEGWFRDLHPNFKELPSWVMYVRRQAFYIPNFNIRQKLVSSVTRLVSPIENISSLGSFERFMNYSVLDVTDRQQLRNKIVGLFPDPEEYDEEIAHLKQGALDSYWRDDTIFGMVTNTQVAKRIWSKYFTEYRSGSQELPTVIFASNPTMFEENTIGQRKLILSDIADIPAFLGRDSIKFGTEFTSNTRVAMDPMLHTLFAFVDPTDVAGSRKFIKSIEASCHKFKDQIQFFWADYRDNLQLMKRLGVEGSE